MVKFYLKSFAYVCPNYYVPVHDLTVVNMGEIPYCQITMQL
jgi:hypothetical protein